MLLYVTDSLNNDHVALWEAVLQSIETLQFILIVIELITHYSVDVNAVIAKWHIYKC
jgi:hypothetical protein